MAKYVIDTSSLTEMRRVYPTDIFPSAWKKLTDMAEAGILISAEDVYEELSAFDDEVLKWAKSQSQIFYPLDHDVQEQAAKILASHPSLIDLKKNKSSADPFIIATAIHNGCTLVTEEKLSNSPVKVKIPDVCKDYDIDCINLVEMFRRESLRL